MKFKKYVSEAKSSDKLTLTINEEYTHPDMPSGGFEQAEDFYDPLQRMIKEGKFDEAKAELDAMEADLNEFEAENNKKRFFKYPKFMIDSQRKAIDNYRAMLPKTESIEDMDKRCEKCNTLLNDMGTCPKCDDGEEDYVDSSKESTVEESIQTEELSNKEKLKRAFPELNFDEKLVTEEVKVEELSNKEKLKRAYPELNFDAEPVVETIQEALSVREKLLKAYPELNFDKESDRDLNEKVSCQSDEEDSDDIQEGFGIPTPFQVVSNLVKNFTEDIEGDLDDYDDDYELEDDDVEQDRVHAALYGGDRMYCDCGEKLHFNEYGSYCPVCDPQEPSDMYDDDMQ